MSESIESKRPVMGEATTVLRRPLRILAIALPAAKVFFDPTGLRHACSVDVVGRYAKLVGNVDAQPDDADRLWR